MLQPTDAINRPVARFDQMDKKCASEIMRKIWATNREPVMKKVSPVLRPGARAQGCPSRAASSTPCGLQVCRRSPSSRPASGDPMAPEDLSRIVRRRTVAMRLYAGSGPGNAGDRRETGTHTYLRPSAAASTRQYKHFDMWMEPRHDPSPPRHATRRAGSILSSCVQTQLRPLPLAR